MLHTLRSASRVLPRRSVRLSRRNFSTGEGGVLVLCEHDNSSLGASTLNAVTAAGQLPGDVTLLVCGTNSGAVAEEVLGLSMRAIGYVF